MDHSTTPLPALPGRAVDIVCAAAVAAEVSLNRISVGFDPVIVPPGWVRLLVATANRSPAEAEILLRHLGITEPTADVTVGDDYRQARYEHECPAIGRVVVVIYAEETIPPAATAVDVAALIAEVDAVRAAAEGPVTP